MSILVRMGVLAGVSAVLYKLFRKFGGQREEDGMVPVHSSGVVRNAGPSQQKYPEERKWDKVDEQVDESFPASDPPANY